MHESHRRRNHVSVAANNLHRPTLIDPKDLRSPSTTAGCGGGCQEEHTSVSMHPLDNRCHEPTAGRAGGRSAQQSHRSVHPKDNRSHVPTAGCGGGHFLQHPYMSVHPKDNRSPVPTAECEGGPSLQQTHKSMHPKDIHSPVQTAGCGGGHSLQPANTSMHPKENRSPVPTAGCANIRLVLHICRSHVNSPTHRRHSPRYIAVRPSDRFALRFHKVSFVRQRQSSAESYEMLVVDHSGGKFMKCWTPIRMHKPIDSRKVALTNNGPQKSTTTVGPLGIVNLVGCPFVPSTFNTTF